MVPSLSLNQIASAISSIVDNLIDNIVHDEKHEDKNLDSSKVVEISRLEQEIIKEKIKLVKKSKKKSEKDKKSKKKVENLESEIKDDDDDAGDSSDEEEIINVSYSFDEEEMILAEKFYGSKHIDYVRMFYGESKSSSQFESEDEYFTVVASADDTEAEFLSTEEAESALVNIQYATVAGSSLEIDSETRRKFDMWIKFNPALFKMFEAFYSVTGDVNYRPV